MDRRKSEDMWLTSSTSPLCVAFLNAGKIMLAYLSLIPLIKFQHKSAGILLIYSNKSGERIILCFFIFSVYICTCSIRSASISLDGTAMVIENIMQIILYWIESAMCMLCGCVDLYDVMHIMFAWHFLLAFFVLLLPPHFAHNSKRLHSHYYYFFFFVASANVEYIPVIVPMHTIEPNGIL